METTIEALQNINRYFHTLYNLGYKKDVDTYNLLVFLYIEELLYGPLAYFINEKDYNDIIKALYCLYGTSCTLPYPDYLKGYDEVVKKMPDEYRITEKGILRETQLENLRVKA